MSTTSDLSYITLVCPECGYDLRAIESGRCPECGLEIDRAAMSVSRLPWAHRRKIGRIRAYWRTNRLAIVRRRRLAEEINRPVSFSDARRFLLVTATLAWIPAAAWIGDVSPPQSQREHGQGEEQEEKSAAFEPPESRGVGDLRLVDGGR